MKSDTKLKDKVALVTGASSGIGKATALGLAAQGVKVFAVARRRQKLDEVQKQFPNLILPVEQDICERELKNLREAIGNSAIDILVNNAGLARGREPIATASAEDIREMFETNVLALVAVTQLVLPRMIEKKSGDIINIGSIAGMFPYEYGSIYCATKASVLMMTDGWRFDLLGRGIRVMGIHPGMAETEFSEVRYRGDKDKAKKVYEGMRALHPEDIAESILWCLQRPAHVNIQSLLIMPTDQAGVGAVHRSNS